MKSNPTLMFLPGASGNRQFWRPVADLLRHPGPRRFWGWPGFGGLPAVPTIQGMNDLVDWVAREVEGPVALLAQSMGGVVALQVALRLPKLVRHIVLSVTSGGIDMSAVGASEWRANFRRNNPDVPRWFEHATPDLSAELGKITAPVLLLWGDADPISPVAAGQRLQTLLPNASLQVIAGGTHDLVLERASEVAPIIDAHLAKGAT